MFRVIHNMYYSWIFDASLKIFLGAGYLSHIEAGGELDDDEEEVDSTNMPKLGLRQVKIITAHFFCPEIDKIFAQS